MSRPLGPLLIQIGYCREFNNDVTAVGQQKEASFIDFGRARWITQKYNYPRHSSKTCYRASKEGILEVCWLGGTTFRQTKLDSCLQEHNFLNLNEE